MDKPTYAERYTLTVKEAGLYFNIGIKKMRKLAKDNLGIFSVLSGNRYLIIRTKFEEYLLKVVAILRVLRQYMSTKRGGKKYE